MGKRNRRRSRALGVPQWVAIAGVAALALVAGGLAIGALARDDSPTVAGTVGPAPAYGVAPVERPSVAFLGDSYTFGTGRTEGTENRWTTMVSNALAWDEERFAVGGTGYVQGDNYVNRVAQVIEASPNVVIVSGGRNDWRVASQVEAAANTVFSGLRAGLPEATIIATNPWWDDDTAPAELAAVTNAVRSAAEANGVTFVDVGQPLQGRPDFLSADGVHPNDAGYQAISDAVQPRLAEIVPTD